MNVATILKHKGRTVVTIKPVATVLEASQTLAAHKIGAALVVDGSSQIRGIMSERDVVQALARDGAQCLSRPVEDYMTRELVSCTEAESIDRLMTVMTNKRVRHLPVVETGALIGIVSIGDVVKLKLAETELEVAAMRDYIGAA